MEEFEDMMTMVEVKRDDWNNLRMAHVRRLLESHEVSQTPPRSGFGVEGRV